MIGSCMRLPKRRLGGGLGKYRSQSGFVSNLAGPKMEKSHHANIFPIYTHLTVTHKSHFVFFMLNLESTRVLGRRRSVSKTLELANESSNGP